MNNPFFNGPGEPEFSKSVMLTAAMYLGLEGDHGYTTPSEFLAYGESLKPKDANNITKLLACMQQKLRMNGDPSTGIDASGKPYTWHEFYKPRANVQFKIVQGGGLTALVDDYADGKVTIAFGLNDLIELSRKS